MKHEYKINITRTVDFYNRNDIDAFISDLYMQSYGYIRTVGIWGDPKSAETIFRKKLIKDAKKCIAFLGTDKYSYDEYDDLMNRIIFYYKGDDWFKFDYCHNDRTYIYMLKVIAGINHKSYASIKDVYEREKMKKAV